ncbi:MAG: hypothetical protein Q8862_08195 [Bacteroidota bacterium]|nr:hypothetical protein [Bacteroidota bacterium]
MGKDANITYGGQSTYILPVQGKKNAFIFMADIWRPRNAIAGRYIWLPLDFENGKISLHWMDEWNLGYFDQKDRK